MVAAHLNEIERERMEVATEESQSNNMRLARSLAAWHEWSFGVGITAP